MFTRSSENFNSILSNKRDEKKEIMSSRKKAAGQNKK